MTHVTHPKMVTHLTHDPLTHFHLCYPARHFCTFVACLPVTPQDSPFYYFPSRSLTVYSACAVTLVILGTLFVHVTYLLTYFLPATVDENAVIMVFL